MNVAPHRARCLRSCSRRSGAASRRYPPGRSPRRTTSSTAPRTAPSATDSTRSPWRSSASTVTATSAWGIDQRRGLHAREAATPCAKCHPDHAGASFSLIAWPDGSRARFDHTRAGWPLEGKHAAAKCESCHAMKFRVSPAAALSKRRGTAGWLGLETSCASCHHDDDVHRNALGAAVRELPRRQGVEAGAEVRSRLEPLPADRQARRRRVRQVPPRPTTRCEAGGGRETDPAVQAGPVQGVLVVSRGPAQRAGFPRGAANAIPRRASRGSTRRNSTTASRGTRSPGSTVRCRAKTATVRACRSRDPPFAACGSCHKDSHRGEATLAGRSRRLRGLPRRRPASLPRRSRSRSTAPPRTR